MFERWPQRGVLDLWAPSAHANYYLSGISALFRHGRTKVLFIRRMRGRATMGTRPSSFSGRRRFHRSHLDAPRPSFDVTHYQPGGNL